MVKLKCIEKLTLGSEVFAYKLEDEKGNIVQVTAEQLKKAIKSNHVNVVNLGLTLDGRLINIEPGHEIKTTVTMKKPKENIKQNIADLVNKGLLLGYSITEVKTGHDEVCILMSLSDTEHLLVIPNNIRYLTSGEYGYRFASYLSYYQGNLKVVGGSGLLSTKGMFDCLRFNSIDLSDFDTSNVKTMDHMFTMCHATHIDVSKLNTSKVKNMSFMFYKCDVQSLDLLNFDTSKVVNMEGMFLTCNVKSLNLSSFNTVNVKKMTNMFCCCKAKSIDLRSFNTVNVTNMDYMFDSCEAKIQTTDNKLLKAYNERNKD